MNGLGAGSVQLWIRSAEPPGEHRYENRNNNIIVFIALRLALNKQINVSSAIVCLVDFDVVREKVPPFLCYRKDNYLVKYPQLIEPLFHNSQLFLIEILNIY